MADEQPLANETPVVGGGENTESLLPDYGDKGSDSYFTRQNQNDYFGFDPEVVRAMQRNVATMNQPDNSNLTTQDYYPLANRGIEVGSFSGPLGSTSLFAAGLPHIPFALDEAAKQQAKLRAAQENEELMAGTTWDYRELKDKLRQESYNNLADYIYTNILKKYQDQYGPLNGAKLAGKSQEWKRANMLLNTYADNLDKYYDVAVNNIMNFQRQNGGGSTSVTEKYKDPNTGVEYTQTDKDGTPMGANGKKYVPYTSPFTYRKSMEYINGIARKPEEMSLDDIEKYNPQTAFVVAESVDKAIDNYFSNSKVVQDISTTIASELAAKNMTQDELGNVLINGKLGTDKENVNLIITKSGFDSDRIKRIAQGIYSKSYSDYEDVYGKEQAKKYVPSVADIEEALQGYIYQQAKVQLDKVSKDSNLDWWKAKQQYPTITVTPEKNSRTEFEKGGVKVTVPTQNVVRYDTRYAPQVANGYYQTIDENGNIVNSQTMIKGSTVMEYGNAEVGDKNIPYAKLNDGQGNVHYVPLEQVQSQIQQSDIRNRVQYTEPQEFTPYEQAPTYPAPKTVTQGVVNTQNQIQGGGGITTPQKNPTKNPDVFKSEYNSSTGVTTVTYKNGSVKYFKKQ